MNSKPIIYVLFLGMILGLALILIPMGNSAFSPNTEAQLVINTKPEGGDFTLTAANGEHSLSDYQGKLVLIYFGYTYCPDVCPTNLGNLSIAYQQLTQDEKDKLQILFISVDPARDTPARLEQYAHYFDANMIGLTSDAQTIANLAKRYGVVYAKVNTPNNGRNYAVDHSAFTYVVDPNGQLIAQLPHATTPQSFVDTIRQYQTIAP